MSARARTSSSAIRKGSCRRFPTAVATSSREWPIAGPERTYTNSLTVGAATLNSIPRPRAARRYRSDCSLCSTSSRRTSRRSTFASTYSDSVTTIKRPQVPLFRSRCTGFPRILHELHELFVCERLLARTSQTANEPLERVLWPGNADVAVFAQPHLDPLARLQPNLSQELGRDGHLVSLADPRHVARLP